ncbi:hypothetical protein BDW69DRAFT_192138 [Aspergillus filifer]
MSTRKSFLDFSHVRGRNDHTWENGQRYHGHTSQFPFPDDATTNGGIVWTFLLDGKPFLAPLPLPLNKGTMILDVAARDGSWIYSVKDHDHPKWIIHEELEGSWCFTAKQAFHFIRGEALGSLLTDWEGFNTNVFKHLVRGGWVEVLEHDRNFHPRRGKEEMEENQKQKALTEEAGLVEVQEQIFKEDTDDLLKRVLEEMAQEDLELYSKFYLIIGRKPRDAPRS